MPSQMPILVALRGDERYAKYLDRLLRAVRKTGVENVETTHQLGAHALEELGKHYGLDAPPRTQPHGTNRYTVRPPKRAKGASPRAADRDPLQMEDRAVKEARTTRVKNLGPGSAAYCKLGTVYALADDPETLFVDGVAECFGGEQDVLVRRTREGYIIQSKEEIPTLPAKPDAIRVLKRERWGTVPDATS